MKYQHDRNASGEIFRLLIQKMSAHPAAFTPLTYSVWYEYVTGINPALREAMAARLESGGDFDDEAIEKLYVQYVCECDMEVQRAMRDDVQSILEKLAGANKATDKQASHFGNRLRTYGDTLKQELDAPTLVALIGSMASDTEKMRGAVQNLQSELKSARQEVEKLHTDLHSARGEALIDPLTGILNRRGFEANANRTLSRRSAPGVGACLVMVDIDHFKHINDTYGHVFGDKVIRGIAETMKSKVGGEDCVARLGGEEFAVLLADTDICGAHFVAEQIRQSVERCRIQRLDTQEKIGGITVSVGVAEHAGGSLEQLLDRADKALYSSKSHGRNRTTVHGSSVAKGCLAVS